MDGQNACQRIRHFNFGAVCALSPAVRTVCVFLVCRPLHKTVQFRCTLALFCARSDISGSLEQSADSRRLESIV